MFENKVTDMITDFRNRVFSEGEAKGRIDGALENAMKTALSLLGAGMAADFVVTHTGLPLADVQRLAAEMR